MRYETFDKRKGPTGSRTQVAGFKVQSANHYTIEPLFNTKMIFEHLLLTYFWNFWCVTSLSFFIFIFWFFYSKVTQVVLEPKYFVFVEEPQCLCSLAEKTDLNEKKNMASGLFSPRKLVVLWVCLFVHPFFHSVVHLCWDIQRHSRVCH